MFWTASKKEILKQWKRSINSFCHDKSKVCCDLRLLKLNLPKLTTFYHWNLHEMDCFTNNGTADHKQFIWNGYSAWWPFAFYLVSHIFYYFLIIICFFGNDFWWLSWNDATTPIAYKMSFNQQDSTQEILFLRCLLWLLHILCKIQWIFKVRS